MLQIAVSYGEGHKFRGTLEGAAPHLFTFLRYPGMPPHNNAAELEIRDSVVLHRNVRHQLSEPEGRAVFSVLVSVARTCYRRGIFPPHGGGGGWPGIRTGAYSSRPSRIGRSLPCWPPRRAETGIITRV